MGGMFTSLKVRDEPAKADPAGWYVHPAGTVAELAEPSRMAADGIVVPTAMPSATAPRTPAAGQ
jgi:hypothetical protein